MSVIGFFESASPAVGSRVQPGGNGMGAGIRVEGAVLEGRMSVGEALVAIGGVRCGGPATLAPWNQGEIDAIWAGRESVFG